MSITHELSLVAPTHPTLLTVGVFDGVHIGHQALLQKLTSDAAARGLQPGVITFRQHPLVFLAPHNAPLRLASLTETTAFVKESGIDLFIPLTFDAALARADARTFAQLLRKYLNMRGLILGWDFAMGHHRSGNQAALADIGRDLGFTTETVPAVTLGDKIVSSTAIRQAVSEGRMSQARAMLGRPFYLEGEVVPGAGRGVKLGFPTANISVDPNRVVPAEGVYTSAAYLGNTPQLSITAISHCPTFEGTERTIEVHLFDFSANIYHQTLRLAIMEYLRPVRRFESNQALQEQVALDITRARELLTTEKLPPVSGRLGTSA